MGNPASVSVCHKCLESISAFLVAYSWSTPLLLPITASQAGGESRSIAQDVVCMEYRHGIIRWWSATGYEI